MSPAESIVACLVVLANVAALAYMYAAIRRDERRTSQEQDR